MLVDKPKGREMKTVQDAPTRESFFAVNDLSAMHAGGSGADEAVIRGVPFWKRGMDVGLLLLALPTLLPLMLLLAGIIKCVSPGPVFFRQERIGFMGRRFKIFKFRTMKVDAEAEPHQKHLSDIIKSNTPMTKMDSHGDPRIIRFGSILRSSGLDELPQLINVFKGEMSLVGPRPCTEYEYEQYQAWHKQRFRAVPGLTGLWQVSGKNKTTFNEMNTLDVYYAHHCSFWLDLKIMFKTLPVLIHQVREDRPGAEKRKAGQ